VSGWYGVAGGSNAQRGKKMSHGLMMWVEGWKVIWRLLLFKLFVVLIALPLILVHVLITRALREDGNAAGLTVYMFYAVAGWLVFAPFIYCIASRLRGEFIYPRYKSEAAVEHSDCSHSAVLD
jgi:hypothetical protein